MLQINNGGLTLAQQRSHFGLWAISKAPLIMGTDVTKLSQAQIDIVGNTALIAVNQDALGACAARARAEEKGGRAPSHRTLTPSP